jgi:hypothetical protein
LLIVVGIEEFGGAFLDLIDIGGELDGPEAVLWFELLLSLLADEATLLLDAAARR